MATAKTVYWRPERQKMVVGFDIDKVQLKIAGVEAVNRGLKMSVSIMYPLKINFPISQIHSIKLSFWEYWNICLKEKVS